jgi:5-carboxymethyl-2-hydroxymuconate isomerase
MPHVIVEYSDNLRDSVDLETLADNLHEVAMASGLMDLAALRTRFAERNIYRIADRHPDNSFMHIVARLREGRDKNDLRALAQSLLTVARESLDAGNPLKPYALTVEIHEITQFTVRHNTVRERIVAEAKKNEHS